MQAEVGACLLRDLAGVVELASDLGLGDSQLLGVPAGRGAQLLLRHGVDHHEGDVNAACRAEGAAKSTAFLALCDPSVAQSIFSIIGRTPGQ